MNFAIYIFSGNVPVGSDKLIIDNKGSEITLMDFLIVELEYCPTPRALPSLKLFVIEWRVFRVTRAQFVNKLDGVLLITSLKERNLTG